MQELKAELLSTEAFHFFVMNSPSNNDSTWFKPRPRNRHHHAFQPQCGLASAFLFQPGESIAHILEKKEHQDCRFFLTCVTIKCKGLWFVILFMTHFRSQQSTKRVCRGLIHRV
jgi:hypothetical protein